MQVATHAAGRQRCHAPIVATLVALGMACASPGVPAQAAAPVTQTAATTEAAGSKFTTPADTPAQANTWPARAPLLAVTTAGARLVAVGLRGLVVWSDDAGKTWTQAKVPVEVDLTAVSFPTPAHGWAVGHRGVVLESQDGGATWTRRFAGQQLNELAVQYYQAQQPQPKSASNRALGQAARAVKEASVPSILDVWFDSPTSGTLVGTFNLIFRTEDGGKTWAPWMDRTDNPDELHFYAVRGGADGLYLAGEKGSVWRLDAETRQWLAVPTGYAGTLFGLVVKGASVLAFGMRGSVFTSDDAGRHWQAGATPRKAGLAAGLRLRSGDIVLADQAGGLLRSTDAGRSFAVVPGQASVLAFSLAQGVDDSLILAGPRGVAAVPLQ